MRNVIAALVAVAAVATVVWFGWSELSARTVPTEAGPGPADVMADFVAAFNADDAEAMAALVHPDDQVGLDGLLAATADMRDSLDLAAVTMSLADIDQGEDRAAAETTVTVALADLPGPDPTDDPSPQPDPSATASGTAGDGGADEVGTIGWLASMDAIERRSGWFVQPDRSTLHPLLTGTTMFRRLEVPTPRASILAADGTPLTLHGDLETLGIEPREIRDQALLVARWGEVLPQSLPALEELLARDDLVADWFYPVVSLPAGEVDAAWARLRTLPSVIRKAADVGTAATSTRAVHVLGTVGAPGDGALADELGVAPDDVVGLSGLERVFEDDLVGSETVEVVLETAEGALVEQLGAAQVDPSSPVSTSLDADLQDAVEAALLGVEEQVAVVAVRTDGGIVASASRPVAGYNRAWEGLYAPGDVFLPVIGAAFVRTGRNLDTPVTCPAEVTVSGVDATAPRPLDGQVRLGRALADGCDTTIAQLAGDLDGGELERVATDFGWGREPSLPLAAATPSFPTPGDQTEVVRSALGQAQVLATPLHLAAVAASTISGTQVVPWLVNDEAEEPQRLPLDTSGLVDVTREAAVDGSGATISERDVGIVVGTAPVTGDDVVHSWSMMLLDDVGLVVLVEDTGGDVDQVRRISRRIEGELVSNGTSTSTEPAPSPTATTPATPLPTPEPSTPPEPTPGATTPGGATPGATTGPGSPSPTPRQTS